MRSTLILTLLFVSSLAASAEVRFQTPPKAVRAGGDVKITFAVSAPTDVEVAILDAKGKVVRHLAAGLLGKNAPSPLKRNSLSQEVLWGGKGDAGRQSQGGPFRARVNLGLRARLDKIIGWSGQCVNGVVGQVCGPGGHALRDLRRRPLLPPPDLSDLRVRRGGKYLRQVFPGPADLPPEKRKGWPRVKLAGGEEMPVIFHLLTRCTYPGAVFGDRIFPAVTADGRQLLILTVSHHTRVKSPDIRGGRRLLILGTDGSVPANFLGPVVSDEKLKGVGHVALSPDDKYAYVMQYATLFKFPPTGGAIVLDPQGDYTAVAQYKHQSVSVKNALWTRRLGYIGSHGRELGCHCETTRFDIDDYDRLYIPDPFRFSVAVMDSAGNEITRFGSYGNMDSRGPGSPVPEPEITFGWPLSVEYADGRVYVADLVNRRVVAVRFEHETEAECAAP